MNAHPHTVPLATAPETPVPAEATGFAQHLMQATRTLVPQFEREITGSRAYEALPQEVTSRVTPFRDRQGSDGFRPTLFAPSAPPHLG